MFNQNKNKKKPPPRPPPPNFTKYKSKSTYNLTQTTSTSSSTAPPNLIEWSPPNSPKPEKATRQFGGSVSSSYSSSASSLASSKKSLENDNSYFNFMQTTLNWTTAPTALNNATTSNNFNLNQNVQSRDLTSSTAIAQQSKPRIIRPPPPKVKIDNPSGPSNRINNDEFRLSDSPPMPKVPPPSPPKEECDVVTPYGIALYDFPAAQPGDLPLQADDVVILLRRVNSDWLYGRVCDKEGIFPDSFVQVEVPLPGEYQTVTALYEFTPQVQGDLPLKPGQKIRIIRKVSDDWLYGESNGQTGQFPRNFVS